MKNRAAWLIETPGGRVNACDRCRQGLRARHGLPPSERRLNEGEHEMAVAMLGHPVLCAVCMSEGVPGLHVCYRGMRINGPGRVRVEVVEELPPRNDLFNHSPDGFEWGYGGSGPSQLALAILCHYFHRVLGLEQRFADRLAVRWYHDFKAATVARMEGNGFRLEGDDVRQALMKLGFDPIHAMQE